MSASPENRVFRIWYYCYPILFGLAYSQTVVFTSNQNTKFLSGLALAGYRDVASDRMAQITDPFPLFSNLLKWQYELFGMHAGVHLAYLLLLAAYAITAVWLVKNLAKNYDDLPGMLFVFSLMWMFIHTYKFRDNWLTFFPDGLAQQYILGNYYQPCVFGVLLISGTAAYLSKRVIPAGICLLLAPLIHPTYLMSSAIIAVTITLVPANRLLDISWSRRLVFLSIFFVIHGSYSLWMVGQLGSGDPSLRAEAHKLLAETRIPHHAVLSAWNLEDTITFLMVGFAAAWIDRKGLIGQLIFVLMLFVGATLVWALVAYNPTLGVAAPWRISAYIAPLSWIVILSSIAKLILGVFRKQTYLSFSSFIKISIVGVLIASLAGVRVFVKQYQHKKEYSYYAVSRFLEDYHQKGYQYLVPINEENIGLEAGVPVFATWKTHPTKDSEFLEWYGRIETARAIYSENMDQIQLKEVMKFNALTHIIWPVVNGDFPYSEVGKDIFSDDNYSLWEIY